MVASGNTAASQHQNYSRSILAAGAVFQVVFGVWLPVLLNASILYRFGFSYALSMCRFVTSFCWIALIAMVWNRCEILFAYSFVLTFIFLSPPLGSEVSRFSIFLAVCGGATPVFFANYISTETVIECNIRSLTGQGHALFRLLAYLKRSSPFWRVLVLACEGVSTLCLIKVLFGFEGDRIFRPLGEHFNQQFADSLEFLAYFPLFWHLPLSLLSMIFWFGPEPTTEDTEMSVNDPERGSLNWLKSVLLVGIGMFLVDYGMDILYSLFPPYRGSFMDNVAFTIAFRCTIVFLLCGKCCQLRIQDDEPKADLIRHLSVVHDDWIELESSLEQRLFETIVEPVQASISEF